MLSRWVISLFISLLASSANAQIVIQDSMGEHHFTQAPQRVATLNWALAEQLIELEAPLIAVADTAGYQQWVAKPALPVNVEDLGARAEPNLEKLARLKPDLIIVANLSLAQVNRLKNIAPVLNFKAFSAEHDNPLEAINNFRVLAKLFAKEALAEHKLAQMQQLFKQLKKQLKQAFSGKVPKVSSVRFANTSSVYIYGDNSMSQYALRQLGITPAIHIEKTQWGLVQKRVLELSKIQEGALLYFEPFTQWQQLQQSRLWQAMPVVRNNRVGAVPATWSYGGAMSLKYLAQAMASSLLSMASASANELSHIQRIKAVQ